MSHRASSPATRPWRMTALAIGCVATVVFVVPRDLFLAGAWGFWFPRPWILPCAAACAFYVALSHLIWSEASPNGHP